MQAADTVSRASPSGDPSGRLEFAPLAARKYAALRRAAEDARAVAVALSEKQYQCTARLQAARAAVERQHRQPAERFYIGEPVEFVGGHRDRAEAMSQGLHYAPAANSKAATAAAENELREAQAQAVEIRDRIAENAKRSDPIVDRIRQWLTGLPVGVRLYDANALPELAKGTSSLAAVEAARADITRLKGVLQEVRSAPLTSDEAKKILARQIEELAARGEVDVLRTVELGHPARFPTMIAANPYAPVPGGLRIEIADTLAVVAWLFRAELIDRLGAAIDEISDDANALSAAERQKRERQARKALLDAERMEEALIESGASEGLAVPRRVDADLYAVLGLAVEPIAP